jgi:hypothetical protein
LGRKLKFFLKSALPTFLIGLLLLLHGPSIQTLSGLLPVELPVETLSERIHLLSSAPFLEFQRRIDRQIVASQNVTGGVDCIMPFYNGEFGYEIAVMVPWAYHWSKSCNVITKGLAGTKYLYYFSKHHEIVAGKRNHIPLPGGNPFGKVDPHTDDKHFPKSNWKMPPWNVYYKRDDIHWDKPSLMISNKYNTEWDKGPINFIPVDTLRDLLHYLSPNYHVVYVRLEHKELGDRHEFLDLDDKSMIRNEFPNVALFDELAKDLLPDSINLLLFSLGALCKHFISVQGGNSVLASLFGGQNIILGKMGSELGPTGDFTYYHRFSNANISVVGNETDLIAQVKQDY